MGLLSFLKRNRDADRREPDAPAGRKPDPVSADEVARARTRARQRLIGAVVLLGIGIVGFPLVFETQPRPVPVDLPIEIPRRDNVPPLELPAPRPATKSAGTVESEAPAERDGVAGVPGARPAAEPRDERVPSDKPLADKPADKPAPASVETRRATAGDDGARARALLDGKPVARADDTKPMAAANARFVVQVGAYADAALAREARGKVEKLGLKTYTQVVDTESGPRIRVRVGPFGTRDEADKAAGRIKSAGLPSAVLTL